MKAKRLLVFTGGGIAPALNPTLVGVIRAARRHNFIVYGGRGGWSCLLPNGSGIEDLSWLSEDHLRLVEHNGGSFLGTSRTNPFAPNSPTDKILTSIKQYDGVIVIGGDDTLGAAQRAAAEGLPIVGVPKTIDNDLYGTYFTPGFPTAAEALICMTKGIKITAQARNKVHLIETLGGQAGWLTASAYLGGADILVPPERRVILDKLLDTAEHIFFQQGHLVIALSHYADLGLASGYRAKQDSYGLQRPYLVSLSLRDQLAAHLDVEVKVEIPGNYLSGADPIEIDRTTATALGEYAVDLVLDNKYGYMAQVKSDLEIGACLLSEAIGRYRKLEDDFFDFESLRPSQQYLDYITSILRRGPDPYFNFLIH